MDIEEFYVYEHYKIGHDEPFYVGKGKGRRARDHNSRSIRWKNIVNKYGFEIRFVAINLNELDAMWLETTLIIGWGRKDLKDGPLVNMTDGGDFGSKHICSSKNKKAQSKRMRGELNPMFDKRHRQNSLNIMKEEALGRRWIVNTETGKVKRIRKFESIPDGYILGRILKK